MNKQRQHFNHVIDQNDDREISGDVLLPNIDESQRKHQHQQHQGHPTPYNIASTDKLLNRPMTHKNWGKWKIENYFMSMVI